jgi:MATE family multidrug resistance protein
LSTPYAIWKAEARSVIQLAGPLVLAEIGWMMMGIVDVMMVGHMPNSAAAIGAVSVGGITFYTVGIFAAGLLLGMDPLVSQAFGAGKIEDCNRTLVNGLFMVAGLSPVLMLVLTGIVPLLRMVGVHPQVMELIGPFVGVLVWSTLPLLLFQAMRHYLQAMNHVKAIMFILVSANVVNLLFNWLLIYGHYGFPALGVRGSAGATVISRIYMVVAVVLLLIYYNRRDSLRIESAAWRPDMVRIREIIRLGLPAATQITLELATWAAAAMLIGKLGPVPIASHQVAVSVVSFTYMMPLGIGGAASVRVGQALGRGDPDGAARSGWVAIALGALVMSCAAIVMVTIPERILRWFTSEQPVIHAGASLLMVAAVFQLFDGIQAVATGALRGSGETRIPMIVFLLAYWAGGVPLAYYLVFHAGFGVPGLWFGFCFALITIGIVLLLVWRKRSRTFRMLGVATPN